MSPAVSVYLALATEAPDVETFAAYAAEARRRGASVSEVQSAKRAWHLATTYRRPVAAR